MIFKQIRYPSGRLLPLGKHNLSKNEAKKSRAVGDPPPHICAIERFKEEYTVEGIQVRSGHAQTWKSQKAQTGEHIGFYWKENNSVLIYAGVINKLLSTKEGMMKKLCVILSLTLILCFTVGCQDKVAMAELEEFKAQAAVEEQNKALMKRLIEAWEQGNIEVWKEGVASEYVWYQPSMSTNPLSREETIESGKMIRIAFPDATISIEEMIAAGDKVITRYIMRGTHEGKMQGMPATGNKVEASAIMISRIENGKLVEDREESDALGLLTQLTLKNKPKEGEK
jgi:steroid delta-isomerase-like uncharacterized protein